MVCTAFCQWTMLDANAMPPSRRMWPPARRPRTRLRVSSFWPTSTVLIAPVSSVVQALERSIWASMAEFEVEVVSVTAWRLGRWSGRPQGACSQGVGPCYGINRPVLAAPCLVRVKGSPAPRAPSGPAAPLAHRRAPRWSAGPPPARSPRTAPSPRRCRDPRSSRRAARARRC